VPPSKLFTVQQCGVRQVMMRRGQDYITSHLPSVHRDMAGISPPDARVQYIRDLSEPPAAHNMHFYRLRRRKYDPVPGNDWLAICPKGLEVYEVNELHCSELFSSVIHSYIHTSSFCRTNLFGSHFRLCQVLSRESLGIIDCRSTN